MTPSGGKRKDSVYVKKRGPDATCVPLSANGADASLVAATNVADHFER